MRIVKKRPIDKGHKIRHTAPMTKRQIDPNHIRILFALIKADIVVDPAVPVIATPIYIAKYSTVLGGYTQCYRVDNGEDSYFYSMFLPEVPSGQDWKQDEITRVF